MATKASASVLASGWRSERQDFLRDRSSAGMTSLLSAHGRALLNED